jgi:hypothetical protein
VEGQAIANNFAVSQNVSCSQLYPEYEKYVLPAIQGYTKAGLYDNVRRVYQKLKLNPELIAQAYMACGNEGRAKEYGLNALLDGYLKERSDVLDTKTGKPKQYKGLSIGFFQKSFNEKEAAVKALKIVINGGELPAGENLKDHLSTLRDGNLGKALRQYVREGMADYLVGGQKVRTVTQFVTELQNQIDNKKTSSHVPST